MLKMTNIKINSVALGNLFLNSPIKDLNNSLEFLNTSYEFDGYILALTFKEGF